MRNHAEGKALLHTQCYICTTVDPLYCGHLGELVKCLVYERRPYFRGVLLEGFHCTRTTLALISHSSILTILDGTLTALPPTSLKDEQVRVIRSLTYNTLGKGPVCATVQSSGVYNIQLHVVLENGPPHLNSGVHMQPVLENGLHTTLE